MTSVFVSRNNVPIRLTGERWGHIVEEHCELAGLREEVGETVTSAQRVLAGGVDELLAVREMEAGKFLVVVYKETAPDDGFIITAFLTRRLASLNRRQQIWPLPT